MKITRWCETTVLIVRAYSMALANSGRTFTRLLITPQSRNEISLARRLAASFSSR
ncbi:MULTISPECIES: hypothetical protein [unclassified Nonomuraea]|uniref:hypothetical protein n=1 Tax=unclassified Nonomuraea TaxID=2593643 RepID=UPI001377AADF|nr:MULTISPECIES: hypothetical protein [unclassified Nonomuraea]NBE93960.1 hypothetical protein [Nonomuraea sp. K271]